MATESTHIAHLARRNEKLELAKAKIKNKVASYVHRGTHTLEVSAGAALGGLLQGLSKDPNGAHVFGIPADLALGLGLHGAGFLDLAGDDYSSHLNNLGDGFLGAYFSDLGFAIGKRKKETGKWGLRQGSAAALPAAAVHGEVSPQQMADALLQRMQG